LLGYDNGFQQAREIVPYLRRHVNATETSRLDIPPDNAGRAETTRQSSSEPSTIRKRQLTIP
jgi:hypothetical protein